MDERDTTGQPQLSTEQVLTPHKLEASLFAQWPPEQLAQIERQARSSIVCLSLPTSLINRARELYADLLGRIARPLDVYGDGELWSYLRVDMDAQPNRTHGIGENPLHMDYVNRSRPPAMIALLGLRGDPRGGGATQLGLLKPALNELTTADRALLSRPWFRYWNDEGARQVGRDLGAFAVIGSGEVTRFTAKMLPHLASAASARDVLTAEGLSNREAIEAAMWRMFEALRAHRRWRRLLPGELVLFSQARVLHGRAAMGEGQEMVEASARRLLAQAYLGPRVGEGGR